jgi:hypothetical protein
MLSLLHACTGSRQIELIRSFAIFTLHAMACTAVMLNTWQEWVDSEIATAVGQGFDVVSDVSIK